MSNYLNICEDIIKLSKSKGITECDVILQSGESLDISVLEGDVDKYESASSHVVGIRTIYNNRVGMAYSESFEKKSIDTMIDMAKANSEAGEENKHEKISFSNASFEDHDQVQKDTSTLDEKIEKAITLERTVFEKDKNVKNNPHNGLSFSKGEYLYMNSHQVSGSARRQYFSCYTSAFYEKASQSSLAMGSSLAYTLGGLDIDYCVTKSIRNGSEWLRAKTLETGSYDVIFDTDILSQLFYTFSNIYSGKELMKNVNPFKDKLGEIVIGGDLTITDDPQYKENFFLSYFDDEGCKQKPLVLVENGKLQSFIHNSVTADFSNTTSTGHGVRGAKSPLSVGLNNLIISGGKLNDLEVQKGKYFEIHKLQGLGSGANSITGEFSAAASGYFCEDGEVLFPVKGVTISGNFHKMMRDIEFCGQKIHSSNSRRFFAPLVKFLQMKIAS